MFSAVKNRRPWVAVIISLLAPFAAMLFLNKGRWALFYFCGIIFLAVGGFIALPKVSHVDIFVQCGSLFLTAIAAVHAYFIARKWNATQSVRWYSRYWYLITVAFYGIFAILFAIRTYLYQPFNVPSAAMTPTVKVGEFFLAAKSAYNAQAPNRGDVIVFRPAAFPGYTFFKRVVGMPGEHVQMKGGLVFINGAPISRRQVSDFHMNCDAGICAVWQYEERLPSGRSYRVIKLTAHGVSDDTEEFTVPADAYFVLGDNRDNSHDSRNGLGYVARDSILGRAAFKYIADGHWTWQAIK